ncbi:type VI secretion system Vgr family protein [Pseudoduganella ginsengisoli]
MQALPGQVLAALAAYSSQSRLYALAFGDGGEVEALLVEAFTADDALQGLGRRDVIVLSASAQIDVAALVGKPATLQISLADGTRCAFTGDVSAVAQLGSNGGLARYRLTLTHWLWRLGQVRNSRVWQDKSVQDIVDDVFGAYAPLARWRWSEETAQCMAGGAPRSYCCQYRESDLAFVGRLLAEEGLAWRVEEDGDGAQLVLFADSTQRCAVPDDPSSPARFHGARAGEQDDTVQALHAGRAARVALTSLLSYDYKAGRVVAAGAVSDAAGNGMLAALEHFDAPGPYHYANNAQAQRYADLQMQGREARSQWWRGRSTLRTLRAGVRLAIDGAPLAQDSEAAFTVVRVRSVGINNLPQPASAALAELFGPIPELLQDYSPPEADADFALAVAQARTSGYANLFEAAPSSLPWRPQWQDSDGRHHHKPTANGSQSAIVVGADGAESPQGADELYCDRLGRVRIRFHWQDGGNATCWVRVAQRAAGGGMGSQFLPRIGQEVLVQFLENDIDRPVIVGALYNGQGEGGVAPTPGGQAAQDAASPFDRARDHAVSGQGNVAGGNSPVWHGASGDSAGHRNGAAQWGIRSKEFGGSGYNQLLFDDTDQQGRVQLKTTHAATELNLGHLIHSADNYRGSLRGQGAELRTDAYGAVRAGAGLLVTSYGISHSAAAREPAGDNTAGIALMKQAVAIAQSFSGAATSHATVALSSHAGAAKASSSRLDDNAAPLPALLTALSGMVSDSGTDAALADAADKQTAPADGKLPHLTDPVIAIAARGGLGVVAGQDVQLANGETVTLMSGADTQWQSGGKLRVHSRQAIGMLGGAVAAGDGGIGLQAIAAQGDVDVQAQAGTLAIQSRDDLQVVSANAHVDWAAARRITLATAGGASITIEGGNITVQAPGKITIQAGKKSFDGPAQNDYPLPELPNSICLECLKKSLAAAPAFTAIG